MMHDFALGLRRGIKKFRKKPRASDCIAKKIFKELFT